MFALPPLIRVRGASCRSRNRSQPANRTGARLAICLQHILDAPQGLDIASLQHRLYEWRDPHEAQITRKKILHCNLVGGIQRRRSTAAGPQRLPRKPQAWKTLQVRRLKMQRSDMSKLQQPYAS